MGRTRRKRSNVRRARRLTRLVPTHARSRKRHNDRRRTKTTPARLVVSWTCHLETMIWRFGSGTLHRRNRRKTDRTHLGACVGAGRSAVVPGERDAQPHRALHRRRGQVGSNRVRRWHDLRGTGSRRFVR
eukprot:scaffold2094_cov300-Pavlova_lutheri.AAC.6